MESRLKQASSPDSQRGTSFQFIILLGIVSLFGDITYEGARSVSGPYLAVLGANAGIVGLVAGLGEFIGYGLRLLSGYLADRTKGYWFFTIVGYGMLLCIPLIAFAGYWQLAAIFLILERMGKAIRTPSRDAILSHATKEVGRGWGFGIHEALDQVGAIIGPLMFSVVFFFRGDYRQGFTILWVPVVLTLAVLTVARIRVPSPEKLEIVYEEKAKDIEDKDRLPEVFWFYTLFTFLSVSGFAHFQLISYHFKVQSIVPDVRIPVLYAIAMGVDAIVALIIGKTYDRIGLISLIAIPLLTIPIPFFTFSNQYMFALAGIVLWGLVMGIHETVMRAAIADLIPIQRRGSAYGIFNTAYGISWFFGSTLMGQLYGLSVKYLVMFAVVMEIISIPVFFMVKKSVSKAEKQ
jgi:MFS family permease